jgi:hypothetical protein
MSTRILQAIGCALVVSFLGSTVEAQTTLTWKFKPGERLNYTNNTDMKQAMSIAGQDVNTTMNQAMDLSWTVKTVQDGKAEVVQKIEQFRQKMEAPFGGFEFDSKSGKKPEGPIGQAVGPIFESMVGAEFSFKMDAQGETSDAKISEKLIQTLQGNPALAQMGAMFSEEGMKNMMQQSSVAFPKEPLSKGKMWNKIVEVKLPFGVMKLNTTYTYQGPEARGNAKLERIDSKSDVTVEPVENANISLKIKSADVTGKIYFDNTAGRLIEASQTQKMVMQISAMGQTFDSTQDQSMTMKLMPATSAGK